MDSAEHKEELGAMTLQERVLSVLYDTVPGRCVLWALIHPLFSRAGGALLNTKLSTVAITPFVKSHDIDLSLCEKQTFDSYNDFFTRKLREDARQVGMEPWTVISPCDARLSVYEINEESVFVIKRTPYTLRSLLRDEALAKRFAGGTLWLYRLCVEDYHRYIYPVDGQKSRNRLISGVFHTVNPLANDRYPIYKENTREYCLLKEIDGSVSLMMEVGAMLVGKIENRHAGPALVTRGEEKGNFAFGGSTIVVITEAGAARPDALFAENTAKGIETQVKLGQAVGLKL